MFELLNLVNFSISDPWGFFNPTSKAFSFFSPVHRTFTRIDYLLLDNRFLPCLTSTSCSYEPMVISDHSPVVLNIRFKGLVRSRYPWRINTSLLSDEKFVDMISRQIDLFLSTNRTYDVSASVLWETLKAYIRGQIISYVNYDRRRRRETVVTLTNRIAQLDAALATSQTPELYKERLTAQSSLRLIWTWQIN